MDTIKPDYLTGWKYRSDYITTNTSTPNSITTCINMPSYLDDEMKRKLNQIYREREAEMSGMSNIQFNDLEKELRELGIQLTTIRHSSGDAECEIEGYLDPSVYVRYSREKSMPTVRPVKPMPKTVRPVKPIPKKVKFSGPATIILWEDGTKTVVKCQEEDVWSDEVGIVMCYVKKMLGNKGNFNNIFREAMKVAEVQTKKEDLTSSTAIEGDSYYISALDSMKQNIAEALDKALGGKK